MAPPMSVSSGDLDKVWEIKTMGKSNDGEARRLLETAAKQVQPIMRKRKWRVKMLREFSPPNPSLLGLNVNRGQEVRIRLREPRSDGVFFPFEHILGTMLHELVHNAHGPHDATFYKLLDEITTECEGLMAKGIIGTGQGFEGGLGRKLSTNSHNPAAHGTAIRQAALAAAEKRMKVNAVLAGSAGPRRLGGDIHRMKAMSPAEAAAYAAERRLRDDQWCPSMSPSAAAETEAASGATTSSRQGEASTSAPASTHTHTRPAAFTAPSSSTLLQDVTNHLPRPAAAPNVAAKRKRTHASTAMDARDAQSPSTTGWACDACTLLNQATSLQCEACCTLRAYVEGRWKCSRCTFQNSLLLACCEMCQGARTAVA